MSQTAPLQTSTLRSSHQVLAWRRCAGQCSRSYLVSLRVASVPLLGAWHESASWHQAHGAQASRRILRIKVSLCVAGLRRGASSVLDPHRPADLPRSGSGVKPRPFANEKTQFVFGWTQDHTCQIVSALACRRQWHTLVPLFAY